ncbi:MAG: SPFH domain-containing protein [Anaerolineaceae bacterium]|nr:SPFH domain-containing protein [Anaerolineaceae bacterium]
MHILMGIAIGFFVWFVLRYLIMAFYTVQQNERAVKTIFGRAERVGNLRTTDGPLGETLTEEHKTRYNFPVVRVIPPGGPYIKWPWEKIYKVSVATQTMNMATDPDSPQANHGGTMLEAVTKDQLNTGLIGQIRYRVAENNLYAYLFGVKHPISHVTGYFVSVLRERIASFEAPQTDVIPDSEISISTGVSINDLRKNLRDLNEHMEYECATSSARYGIVLDASLITGIDPPQEVDSALAAINTAHNQVSSDISMAQAAADQKIVQSKRAVEIETLNAQAEVEPLVALADQLRLLRTQGPEALEAYLRNVRLRLYTHAQNLIREVKS